MRLIDADKLIEELKDFKETKIGGESIHTKSELLRIDRCIDFVKAQETAYDVDRVLEQLEYSRVPNTGIAGFHKVVEIVKGGGRD